MQSEKFSAILFYSNNYAIWSSKLLRKKGMPEKLISVPRHISSDCGYCVRIKAEDMPNAEKLMIESEIEFDRIIEFNSP